MSEIDTVVDPVAWQRIQQNIRTLMQKRASIQDMIDELTRDGCVHGNIVDEFRNVTVPGKKPSGPYYRLTFYTDPKTGVKPRPKYLGKNMERVQRVQEQIDNYKVREEYTAELTEINRVLDQVRSYIKSIDKFLQTNTEEYQQPRLVTV